MIVVHFCKLYGLIKIINERKKCHLLYFEENKKCFAFLEINSYILINSIFGIFLIKNKKTQFI